MGVGHANDQFAVSNISVIKPNRTGARRPKERSKAAFGSAVEELRIRAVLVLGYGLVGLDEGRRALDALEQALRDHKPCMVSLKVDAIFDLCEKNRVSKRWFAASGWSRD